MWLEGSYYAHENIITFIPYVLTFTYLFMVFSFLNYKDRDTSGANTGSGGKYPIEFIFENFSTASKSKSYIGPLKYIIAKSLN